MRRGVSGIKSHANPTAEPLESFLWSGLGLGNEMGIGDPVFEGSKDALEVVEESFQKIGGSGLVRSDIGVWRKKSFAIQLRQVVFGIGKA